MQDINKATDQAKKLGEELQADNLLGAMNAHLQNIGSSNLQALQKHNQLKNRLLEDIAAKKPFSLLRLGDGEGNTLFWGTRKTGYTELAKLCMDRIWKLMFGRNKGSETEWNTLYEGMAEAVKNADYIGIPTPEQASSALARFSEASDQGFDIRGTTGIVGVWDWVNHYKAELNDAVVYVNWHVHKSLLEFYEDLIQQAGNLSVITCYPDLMGKLHNKCGVQVGNALLIPAQAVNIKGTPEHVHYPDRFNEISRELSSADRKGELFFVGAGLAGKLYCEIIRRSGGMAVDVGSLMDVWMGLGVRPYQSSDFVEKHKIVTN